MKKSHSPTLRMAVAVEQDMQPPPQQLENHREGELKRNYRKRPTLATWKRRLNTKEDSKWTHKTSGIGFMISSTLILAGGAVHGFQELPDWLTPINTAFLVATMIQSTSSVQMVERHRRKDPEKGRTFSQMAVQSMITTFLGTWFSPYCPDVFLDHPLLTKAIYTGMIAQAFLLDFQYTFAVTGEHCDGHIVEQEALAALAKETNDESWIINQNNWMTKFILRYGMMILNLPNIPTLITILTHNREEASDLFTRALGLYDTPCMTVAPLYYILMLTSTLIAYSSLVSTLSHKKLVSRQFELQFAGFTMLVLTGADIFPFLGLP